MITKIVKTEEKELSRAEIDTMVHETLMHLYNTLLNKKLAQHRDEARVLTYEVLKNSPVIKELFAEDAKRLLETGQVQFHYADNSDYKSTFT